MRKQYILYIVIAILSLTNILNINNVSALDYSSNVGIGFTFNPTLSINISSSDLVISLKPGTTEDSNSINVSVATNASYGYTLSATVGDSNHDNSNLTHSNNTNVFSSIAIDADLSSFDEDEDTNIWGYSYRNNITSPSTWSNYNGLSSSSNAILLDNSNAADSTGGIDFKIGAKAGDTQASGTYTNTINFIAVSKVAPMSLLDSFIASGAKQLNGYYKMQDMTHDICESVDIEESELQLIDVRDNKIYWVAKLKDGNCWMTQNLDLDLMANNTTLNSTNTDINIENYNPNSGAYSPTGGYVKDSNTDIITWSPERSTTTILGGNNFPIITNTPLSYDPGEKYYYTSGTTANDIVYNSTPECVRTNHTDCIHYSAGNYYSWTAAAASNNTSAISNAGNSICPKSWGLPKTNDFNILGSKYSISDNTALNLRNSPLYLTRSGYTYDNMQSYGGSISFYWSSTKGRYLRFNTGYYSPSVSNSEYFGFSIRCIAK